MAKYHGDDDANSPIVQLQYRDLFPKNHRLLYLVGKLVFVAWNSAMGLLAQATYMPAMKPRYAGCASSTV